jgi:hypothetical protein
MENKNSKKDSNKERNKKTKVVLIIVILIVIAVSIVFIKSDNPKVIETISKIPGINKVVTSETMDADDVLDIDKEKERLQKEVKENTLNARIASSLEPDKDGFVYLSLKNKYEDKLLQVTIVDEESEEIYYTSSVLNPGDEIDFGKLSLIPTKGSYNCIAYFYYYTLEENPISMVGAKVKLNTKGE